MGNLEQGTVHRDNIPPVELDELQVFTGLHIYEVKVINVTSTTAPGAAACYTL